jgi:hypothetical protein
MFSNFTTLRRASSFPFCAGTRIGFTRNRWLAAGAVFGAVLFSAPAAFAGCVAVGDTVTCDGSISGGWSPSSPGDELPANSMTFNIFGAASGWFTPPGSVPTTLSNSANISADHTDAIIVNATTPNFTFTNTGNITVNGTNDPNGSNGVDVWIPYIASGLPVSTNVTIANSGTIITTGDNSAAIAGSGRSGDTTIYNSGVLLTSGYNSYGIESGSDSHFSLINSGTITTLGDYSFGMLANGGKSISVTNSGTISTSGAYAHGIVAAGGTLGGSGPSNATYLVSITGGSVTATGPNASGINAIGVDASVDMNVSVASGATVTGGTGLGAGVHFGGGGNNTLTNYGVIASAAGLSGYAVLGDTNAYLSNLVPSLALPVGNNTVNNYGAISGNVDLGAGINAFNNNAGATFNAGTVINLNGGTLTNRGTLAIGAPGEIQTTALTGTYMQTSSGSLLLALNAATGDSSKLAVTGDIWLKGTISVTQAGQLLPGTVRDFTIASAQGSIYLDYVTLPASTPWISWRLLAEGSNLVLEERKTSTPQLFSSFPAPVAIPAGAATASAAAGPGNLSTVYQYGNGNAITNADQAAYGTGSGNLSVINQGSAGNASYNSSASIVQHSFNGGLASSLINQDSGGAGSGAAGNVANVTQAIGPAAPAASVSTVNQSGSGLRAAVNQGTIAAPVDAYISGVSSYIEQIGSGAGTTVGQTARNASSVVIQHGAGSGGWNASVSQSDGWNTSGISQLSAVLGTVNANQHGTGTSDSQVWQSATAAANIDQAGSAIDISYVSQTSTAGGASASVTQGGSSDNQSQITQTGGGSSNVFQTGAGELNLNQSAIGQSGTGIVNVYQGYSATGVSDPSGASANFSSVTQTGNGSVTVVQSGGAGLTNFSLVSQDYASTAFVWQTAASGSNDSSVTQTGGGGNAAYVRQR